ncbi:MAG: hypothetical protein QXH30_02495 [Candidatus Bilamarchaeaceae archaeon]
MQDSKEEKPPSAPDEIVKLSKYKISSDANPREIFWAMVKACKEGGDVETLAKRHSGIREALVNIGCSVLKEESKAYRVKLTRAKLANCLFSMIVLGRWGDVLERAFSHLYERKKGPDLNMLLAFGEGFSRHRSVVGPWLKQIITADRPPEAALSYIANAGDREMILDLRAELLNIARTEINEPQLYAMESLSVLLAEDNEVVKLFLDMMDDWDLETKQLALETLAGKEIPEAGKKAVSLYPYEQDERFRIMLERIVDKNWEACKPEFTRLIGSLEGREMLEVAALAKKIYGRGAKKLIPDGLGAEKKKMLTSVLG